MLIRKKQKMALFRIFKRKKLISIFQISYLLMNALIMFIQSIYNLYAASRDGQIIHIMQPTAFDSTAKL